MDCGAVAKNMEHDSQQEEIESVYFLDDTILEAVKFLNYEKWSKMRFLCYRINQLIHSNQSKLQAFEVKSLSMSEIRCIGNSIVSFDETIEPADAVRKWFQDRGYSCDETTDMPLAEVFAGMNPSWHNELDFTFQALFEEPIENCRLPNAVSARSKLSEVFSAELNDKHEFYGLILSHFFRLLHHPAVYFREVSMFTPMTDKFCDMTSKSPIQCEQFTLRRLDSMPLDHSLKWLKDNVRAQNIRLALNWHKMSYPDLHSLVWEFILLLDPSVCVQDHIKLFCLPHPGEFVKTLIKKYETLEVTKTIPSILIEDCPSEIPPGYYQYLESIMVRQDDPIVADKFCDKCNVKSYEQRNKLDGNRKMIVQVGRCPEPRCDGYIDPIVYMKFE